MKIRIEGCTAEELADYSPYLSLGKVYEATHANGRITITDDEGEEVRDRMGTAGIHLPGTAEWVEVPCCEPTAEERQLLTDGDCTPEELWGGPRPTCPECIGK